MTQALEDAVEFAINRARRGAAQQRRSGARFANSDGEVNSVHLSFSGL
jgi:hypothetical protein